MISLFRGKTLDYLKKSHGVKPHFPLCHSDCRVSYGVVEKGTDPIWLQVHGQMFKCQIPFLLYNRNEDQAAMNY